MNELANSAFHPSGVGKWVPASAGKAKAGMVHSVSGWTGGVQVKLWDPLRTRAIPERLRGAFTTRRYTNPRLRLPLPLHCGNRHFGRFRLLWPWPWPDDIHIRTWPVLPGAILNVQTWTSTSRLSIYIYAYIHTDRQTDRQTESTGIIKHAA